MLILVVLKLMSFLS